VKVARKCLVFTVFNSTLRHEDAMNPGSRLSQMSSWLLPVTRLSPAKAGLIGGHSR
jgi:hypothetical protein